MEDRRAHERIDGLEAIMEQHITEHDSFENTLASSVRQLEENMAMTKRIAENTDEMVELLRVVQNARGFVATMKAAGKVVLWMAAVGGALAVMLSFTLAAMKFGLNIH